MMNHTLRPRITLSDTDHHQLLVLAMAGTGHTTDAGENLYIELDRARIVPEAKLPADVVRMGSTVTYRAGDSDERTVTLVYPVQADISSGKISVMTPIGTALIGLKTGQSITWTTRDGHKRVLTALAVSQPVPEPAE